MSPREPSAYSIIKENIIYFSHFTPSCPCNYQLCLRLVLALYRDLYGWDWETVLKAKQYLVVHYTLKDLSVTSKEASPYANFPQGDTRILPRAQPAKVCTCGQLFCLKTYPRMKNHSYKLCHSTRLSREVSSELPGRKFNEVTLFLFLLSLLWVWLGRLFWSINAQMVVPAWNALPKVITVQDILLWFN